MGVPGPTWTFVWVVHCTKEPLRGQVELQLGQPSACQAVGPGTGCIPRGRWVPFLIQSKELQGRGVACEGRWKELSENPRPYLVFLLNYIFIDFFLESSSMNFIMCINMCDHRYKQDTK